MATPLSPPFVPPPPPMSPDYTICEVGGDGGMALPTFGDYEQGWATFPRAVLYFTGMVWSFVGIAIVADLFMGAIEQITSTIRVYKDGEGTQRVRRVWNPTVANLSLMALGSSAPEILLNVLEIVIGDFFTGDLGPSTIVGSAAFNLLIITAVCVVCITDGTKKIDETNVYTITAVCSVLAYIWLLIMVKFWTPEIITVTEAALTFSFFWLLLASCYWADKNFFRKSKVAPGTPQYEPAQMRCATLSASITDAGADVDAAQPPPLALQASAANLPKSSSSQGGGSGSEQLSADGPRSGTNLWRKMRELTKINDFRECNDHTKQQLIIDELKNAEKSDLRRKSLSLLTGKSSSRPGSQQSPRHASSLELDALTQTSKEAAMQPAKSADDEGKSDARCAMGFKRGMVEVLESLASVELVVLRTGAADFQASVHYKSYDVTAVSGKDYTGVEGDLDFGPGVTQQSITLKIHDDQRLEHDETFRVELSDPSDGAAIDKNKEQVCVKILNDDGAFGAASRISHYFYDDHAALVRAEYIQQFADAVAPVSEDGENPSALSWFFHCITIFWKVLFATVPPQRMGGGWPAFSIALGYIAILTVLVGDMANLFGCLIGWPSSITAITFVALGTSMPDTFASKAAAQSLPNADDCIGNVTGSNCVNVFLGLGLPWLIGAVYWEITGIDETYTQKYYRNKWNENSHISYYYNQNKAVFVVTEGDLGNAVVTFCCCAAVCLCFLYFRRRRYGGELGGPLHARYLTALLFVSLWGIYILISVLSGGVNVLDSIVPRINDP